MTYEELTVQLCEVIKESEINAQSIYDNAEFIEKIIIDSELPVYKKDKVLDKISEIIGLLQHQDLHRQKIERVVNVVCERNEIDKNKYNLAPSAKNIDSNDETLTDDEIEALIKQMQS